MERKEMIGYLKNHFRYDILNSWNGITSYAKNVKIYNLNLDKDTEDKLWDAYTNCYEEVYDSASYVLTGFRNKYSGKYQIGCNGRSGGYLVLYQGEKYKLDYKSTCTNCGQKNYKTVEETNSCKCGRCGRDTRVNLKAPLYSYRTFSRGMDMDEDFEDWSDEKLKNRFELVKDFDRTCEEWLNVVIETVTTSQIEEEIEYVPVTRHRLVMAGA